MWKILLTLMAGSLLGYLASHGFRFAKLLLKTTPLIITGGLIFLLVSMGAGLSSNPDVINQIGRLGFQAFILAFFGIFGSVILVSFLQKIFYPHKKGEKQS